MRTLNRPMFKMGGPIKEGVMHGIREPYKGGGAALQAALVGNPVYPKTRGREHHVWNLAIPAVRALASFAIGKGGKAAAGKTFQNVGKTIAGKGTGTGIASTAPAQGFWRSAWERDPLVRGAKWLKGAIMSPTAKGIGQKVVRGVATPTGALTAGWFGYPMVKGAFTGDPKTREELLDSSGIQSKQKGPPGGTQLPFYTDPDKAKKLAEQKKNERVDRLLKTMGYDTAKKDAISKALVDASQIVSERGTLDKKNIVPELINPIIQATSKRLEKPEQLNEAVRLMMTKADIEKEMNPLKDEALRWQIEASKKTVAGKGIKEITSELAGKGTPLVGANLATAARAVLPGDFKLLTLKVPKKKDTLDHLIEVVKDSHTDPEKDPFPAGQYVLNERIVIIDDQGNVTPLDV